MAMERLTGLWPNTDRNGKLYYSGKVLGGTDRYVLTINTKDGPDQPFYWLLKQLPDVPPP